MTAEAVSPRRPANIAALAKFGLVGLMNTALTVFIILAMKRYLTAGDVIANAVGYGFGICLGYAVNSRWTFGFQQFALSRLVQYVVVSAIAYGANLATVLILIHAIGWNSYPAQIAGAPVYTLTAFVLSRLWVFRHPPNSLS